MFWPSFAILFAIAVVLFGTDGGRDFLARRIGRWLPVDRVIETPGRATRNLFAYRATLRSPSHTRESIVLAASQAAVSEALLTRDGDALQTNCLLAPYRVIPDGDAFVIALLPGWLSWAGTSTCEHGGKHTPSATAAPPLEITPLEALITQRQSVSEQVLYRALLESEVLVPNLELVESSDGKRLRLMALELDGRTVIPMFSSDLLVPADAGLRWTRHSFRALLDAMRPPRAPVVVNLRSPLELELSLQELEKLQAMSGATR